MYIDKYIKRYVITLLVCIITFVYGLLFESPFAIAIFAFLAICNGCDIYFKMNTKLYGYKERDTYKYILLIQIAVIIIPIIITIYGMYRFSRGHR
jgi:hypothetical protein